MNCVKCGRETGEDQVFCKQCLEEMENYPVKPGTAIHIPPRTPDENAKKAPQKKKTVRPQSEQILRLKKKVLRLRILAVVLLLICGALCLAVERAVVELDFQRLLGQNYHTQETEAPTEQSEPTELTTETEPT